MKRNIKQLSLLLLLALGHSSSNYNMPEHIDRQAEDHSNRIQQEAGLRADGELTAEEHERLLQLNHENPSVRARAVRMENRMATGSREGINLNDTGSFDMLSDADTESNTQSFEQRNPRTAQALRSLARPFRAVSDFFANRGASPEEMPSSTEDQATKALERATEEGEKEGLSWETIKSKVKESTLGKLVGRARTAVSDFIDEKMHQLAHPGKTDYNDRRKGMKEDHQDRIDSLEKGKQDDLAAKREEHKAALKKMSDDFNAQMKKTQAQHKELLDGLQSPDGSKDVGSDAKRATSDAQKADRAKMTAEHNLKVAKAKMEHSRKLDETRSTWDQRISTVKSENANELDQLNANIRAEVATGRAQDRHIQARAKSWAEEANGIERARKSAIDAQKSTQQSELANLRAQQDADLAAHDAKQTARTKDTPGAKAARQRIIDDSNAAIDAAHDRHATELDEIDAKYDASSQAAAERFKNDREAIKNPQSKAGQQLAKIDAYRKNRMARRLGQ